MNCGKCGVELLVGNSFCSNCGEGVTEPREVSTRTLPYRWGKTFSIISAFFCLVAIAVGVFIYTHGLTTVGFGGILVGGLLGAQAWGLFRKRRFGLYIFYVFCVFIVGQLGISYIDFGWNQAYLEARGEAWFNVFLYLGSLPYFIKRRLDFT